VRTYKLRILPLGPWATPWHADTLFGALCWQIVRLNGAGALTELLAQFQSGEPPFLLSDAFPEGKLPCPLSLPLQPLPETRPKRPAWLDEEQFRNNTRKPGPLLASARSPVEPIVSAKRLHASIDRRSGTTTPNGALFEVEAWRIRSQDDPPAPYLNVFVRVKESPASVERLFRSLSFAGFGKKKSSGFGAFEVVGEPEPCPWLDEWEWANGFVSLSHFVPAHDDPTEGCWRVAVKYPKFSPGIPVSHPFKGRLLMIRPGSVFRATSPVRPFYGTVLQNLSAEFPEAVHYALAFAVPLRWSEA